MRRLLPTFLPIAFAFSLIGCPSTQSAPDGDPCTDALGNEQLDGCYGYQACGPASESGERPLQICTCDDGGWVDCGTCAEVGTEVGTRPGAPPPEYCGDDFSPTPRWVRPIAEWSGRLELPSEGARDPRGGVYLHVENAPAPHADLVGQRVWLRYGTSAGDWVERVRTDIRFSDAARASATGGNVHPERLDGWDAVSPLESLAGARGEDNVRVALHEVSVSPDGDELEIGDEPVQIEGSVVALVRFVASGAPRSESFRARHFDPRTGTFDGPEVEIRMMRAMARSAERAPQSQVGGIEASPLNAEGWWVYGDAEGSALRVNALEPRGLMRVAAPEIEVREGLAASMRYVREENWDIDPSDAGTHEVALLTPRSLGGEAAPEHLTRIAPVGTQALVVHLFGGVSGQPGEVIEVRPPDPVPGPTLTVTTGHFSFGIATVVRDPFTGEARWDIEYRQVYAHNGNGIVSGALAWHSYMGSLERGWMYVRPVHDAIVRLDALTEEYRFGGEADPFVPSDVFLRDLAATTAHYRTGRGTGASIVTPANSCVQDSNQALFVSLSRLEAGAGSDPAVRTWLDRNAASEEARRFATLTALAAELEDFLRPLGLTRSDWAARVDDIGAVDGCPGARVGEIACGLESYNTIFPRNAYDRELEILLEAGATVVVIGTNQIGGDPPAGFGPIPATLPTVR